MVGDTLLILCYLLAGAGHYTISYANAQFNELSTYSFLVFSARWNMTMQTNKMGNVFHGWWSRNEGHV